MTTTKDSSTRREFHPDSSPKTKHILDARLVDYFFEPNLTIAAIRMSDGHQVRFEEHHAPKPMVERYAEQMRHGAVFPAIVVTDAYEMIDGNTRRAAAVKNGLRTMPAYVCSGMSSLEMRSLSIELNQIHGLRMTDSELRNFIVGCVQNGAAVDVSSFARVTGVKVALVTRWIGVERFRVRAANLGMSSSDVEGLSEAIAVAVQGARLNAVFAAATSLAGTTGCSAADLKAVVTRANAAASEAEALEIIGRERAARPARVGPTSASRPTRRNPGSALHLGGLLRFGIEDLLDVAPEKHGETYAGLRLVRDLLVAAVRTAETRWEMRPQSTDPSRELLEVA